MVEEYKHTHTHSLTHTHTHTHTHTPVASDTTLPALLETPNEILSSLKITASDISKIIEALNLNKACGYNEISIRMFKLC